MCRKKLTFPPINSTKLQREVLGPDQTWSRTSFQQSFFELRLERFASSSGRASSWSPHPNVHVPRQTLNHILLHISRGLGISLVLFVSRASEGSSSSLGEMFQSLQWWLLQQVERLYGNFRRPSLVFGFLLQWIQKFERGPDICSIFRRLRAFFSVGQRSLPS